MALVSMPPCHSATGDAVNTEGLNKKRASIHYPDDSTATKRLSLHFGHRCRSLSESWAITSTETVVPESQEKKKEASNLASTSSNTGAKDEEMDKELLKTLSSFLKSQGQSTTDSNSKGGKDRNPKDRSSTMSTWDDKTIDSGFFPSAGPSDSEPASCDLVVTVRDFAYATSHPFHRGEYPPEPVYEESDIEEDYDEDFDIRGENVDDDDEEDRTQGQARGLYDFDAENESELSFKEGDFVWIHYRQFPGWFLGEKEGKSGLVPENYVQLL
ncbi:HOG (high osmolarity glycerol) pathway protein [Linnemannia schmuckeri]|uniref:HOG (High osmolarity glycerol) pathway protein n=1 Tax=Linnemannia schmuckeri TaxID=64567 RepID=A0A9P5VEY8_9FUNG|nr:HOG (high osmolarity glycerol) pathway protein [Linnemannia schmuckeri]